MLKHNCTQPLVTGQHQQMTSDLSVSRLKVMPEALATIAKDFYNELKHT